MCISLPLISLDSFPPAHFWHLHRSYQPVDQKLDKGGRSNLHRSWAKVVALNVKMIGYTKTDNQNVQYTAE